MVCTYRPKRAHDSRCLTTFWPISVTNKASSSRSQRSRHTSGGSPRSSVGRPLHRSCCLDELGAGTDPADGAALGRAILDELESTGARSIVTTHIGDLKTYALTHPAAENAAVEFDDQTLEPKYRLHIGDIGQSNALSIARHLQLPEHVVTRAESYLAERPSRGVPEWEAVQRLRAEAELARQAALQAQSDAERARDALARAPGGTGAGRPTRRLGGPCPCAVATGRSRRGASIRL